MIAKGDVLAMVRSVLKDGQTAVDVGAATGTVCEVMRECVGPRGTVIAIEPRDTLISGYDVIRHKVACCGRTGLRDFYVPAEGERSSFYKDAVFSKKPSTTIRVATAKLDDLVDTADLVKLDVQGAEMAVLSGAKRLLQTCPIWILEVWPHGLICAGESLQKLWDKLHSVDLIPYAAHGPKIDYDELTRWNMDRGSPMPFMNWLCKRG